MARHISTVENLPAFAQETARRVELMGFTEWSWLPDAPLPDLTRRVQVRDIDKLAPLKEVAAYAASLKRGDLMPPVITTRDGYLVDGATRIAAARRIKRPYYPQIRINVSYESAPLALEDQLIELGTAFNMTHGRSMNRANVERVLARVTHEGDSPKDIAARLGNISESTVANFMNAQKACKRAQSLGVEVEGTNLTPTHLARLGSRSPYFDDDLFADLVETIILTNMSTTDADDLAKRLKDLGNNAEKVALLKAETESRPYGSSKPSKAGQLRRSLGMLGKYADQPGLLVETNPAARALHRQTVRNAIEVLEAVSRAQFNLEQE